MNDRDFWTTVFLQALQDNSVAVAADHADASLAKLRERFGPVHFTVRQPTSDPMVDPMVDVTPDRLEADSSSDVRANERSPDKRLSYPTW